MRWLALVVAVCVNLSAQASGLPARLEQIRLKHDLAGVLAARIKDGRIVELAAHGCAHFAGDGKTCERKLSPDDFVRVASISKLVTAVGVMRLVEQGKIDLDKDVSDVLGFPFRNPAFPNVAITARMLLSHTGTLRDGDAYWVDYPGKLTDIMSAASRFDSTHRPGTYFTYTNLNYGVLAQIIERASGERFDVYMQRAVFNPLGIQAGYNWSGLNTLPATAVGTLYRKQKDDGPWTPGGPWIAQIDDFKGTSPKSKGRGYEGDPKGYVVGTNGTLFSPQGGLRISLRNLAKLTAYLARAKSPAIDAMTRPAWSYAKIGGLETGNSEGGFYRGYGSGPQLFAGDAQAAPQPVPGHFADAYGLRGGLLFDRTTKQGWIYLITGFSDDPSKGPAASGCAYPGLGPSEADMLCAVWNARPFPDQIESHRD
jgi:CubicO group peptidase (beta-lactamase class C family)